MFKRNTVRASILSALALTMLCLCSSVATAQKGPPSTDSSVKPIRGIDVIVQKNPGNTATRIVPTDKDGNADFGILAAGNYSVTLKRQHGAITITKEWDAEIKEVVITITGATGGQKSRVWNLAKGTFHAPEQATAKTTDTPSFDFTTDGHGPIIFNTSISKSRSNVKNNARTGNPN